MPVSDQGATRDRYMLIPRVLIFITRGSRVLLIKGASNKRLWADKYNGVGGHVEPGEDILTAAQRELIEETGLTADLWLCGTVVVETGRNPGIGMYVFKGESLQGEPRGSSEGILEWVPFAKVKDLPVVEDLPVLLKRIHKMKRGDSPFSARSHYADDKLTVVFAEK
jgi:8-oxo-dGTP diphosphatase